jgi:Protein of unknown function (DUF3618)
MTDKSTRELELEAEQARAQVADTADSIRAKMSPGQLIDEFTGYFSGGDGSVALHNLGSQVRDNPMPIALIGAGLAWLMLGKGAAASGSPGQRGSDAGFGEVGSNKDAQSAIGNAFSTVREKLSDVSTGAATTARSAGQSVKDSMAGLTDQAASTSAGLADQAKQTASAMLGQDPLILAALGVAVGTAIGVALPHTTIEDQQLGPYRDRLKEGAEDALNTGLEAAKDVAGKAYVTAKRESDNIDGGDRTIAEKVGDVVRTVAADAETNIRDKIGGASKKQSR